MCFLDIVFNTAFNCLPMAFFMFYISDDYELLYDYNSTYQNAFYLCLGIVLIAGTYFFSILNYFLKLW